jgi:hypothetical protein
VKYIVYDIETYQSDRLGEYINQKDIKPDARLVDPKKIEADIVKKKAALVDKAALSPITGRVTCMGLSYMGDFKFFIGDDEQILLEDINTFIEGKEVSHFVGKNSWDFDLPFLRVRHLANKMPVPTWLLGTTRHIDIKQYFGKGMGMRGPSMKDLEWVMDIQRDGEKDALQALTWWAEDDWDSLEKYCEQDVRTTESIFLALSGLNH